MKKKIVTVLGARPQFIKASVVSRAFDAARDDLEEIVVHTGQHFDRNMSDVFFSGLRMRDPKYHLDIHGGGHGAMTGRMLAAIVGAVGNQGRAMEPHGAGNAATLIVETLRGALR